MIRSIQSARSASVASTELKAQTKVLANRQAIVDHTSVDSGKPSITPLNPGEVLGFIPVPKKITVTVTNTNVVGGALDISLFNNDTFEALPVGVTVVDSVGFVGKLLNKLIQSINNGQGLLIYGFNAAGYNAAGERSDVVLNSSALEARFYKGYGSSFIPGEIDIAGAERNTQTKDGLITVKSMFMLNFLTQLKLTLGQEEKIQFVFFTQPMVD